MRERKTVDVETLRANVNRALATETAGNTADYRRGVAAVLEDALNLANRYRGFRYLEQPYVEGQTDETRRSYY